MDIKNVREVPELQVHDVYVFSYFYDRGVQANIIRNSHEQKGGWATVGDYKLAAERACSLPAEAIGPEHWQPWQCLDLTYIYSLLHYGYGMPDDKEIHVCCHIYCGRGSSKAGGGGWWWSEQTGLWRIQWHTAIFFG